MEKKHVWHVVWCMMSFQRSSNPSQPLAGCSLISLAGSPGGGNAACWAQHQHTSQVRLAKPQGSGTTSAGEMGLGRVGFALCGLRETEQLEQRLGDQRHA